MAVDSNTPIWQLTVGQFVELQQKIAAQTAEPPVQDFTQAEERWVYGMNGLCKLLNCSGTTAWRLKKSGRIDRAIKQQGRKIVFDAPLVMKILSVK